VRVLRVLATQEQPIGTTLIAKQSGLTWKGATLVLDNLANQQIVQTLGSTGTQLFQLNRRHPLAAVLETLFQAEQNRWTELLQAVRRVLNEHSAIQAAWYYGSVARGEDTAQSDFDIGFIAANDEQLDTIADSVREALRPVEDQFSVAISVVGLSGADVSRLCQKHDEWWASMTQDARSLKGKSPQGYAAAIQNGGET
jgi:predicted nucleotidyltransferase